MRCYWGVTDKLPVEIISVLPNQWSYGFCSDPDLSADVLLIASVYSLRKLWPRIKDLSSAAIIFDTEPYLGNYSIPLLRLDVPIEDQLLTPNTLKIRRHDPIQKLLNKTASSFVANFSTYVYTIKDKMKQAETRTAVLSALWNQTRKQFVAKQPKRNVELIALLQSSEADTLEAALQELKHKRLSVEASAKKHGVAVYDLNYVLKFLGRLQ